MKTPEQSAANEALRAAIEQVQSAYEYEGLSTGWFLGVSSVEWDDDGDQRSGIWWLAPEGQPWTTTLGVLSAVTLRMHADYLAPDCD